ncbi:actin-related protein 5-like [Lingula anatina]|uniref:Actin-related protein 5 n=1 Tax=Lingula anatina TaxID=7574 RepID=A0A1S3KGZ3_LINAN|nr:actin-related protein 5-like [Lingula anatina]|eukprot:XP_013421729.1 actin-related protein 5-like [Lingula anatina]
MAAPEDDPHVFTFKDEKPSPDPIFEYPDSLRDSRIPLIIDNGSYQCRAGWASDEKPKMIFKNLVARQRGKKDLDALIGNDIGNLEVMRWQLKSQFDRNIVTQFDLQEQVLDHLFSHLGINTQGQVDHPVVMTEPVCNPNHCRQQMSELLFEGYHVPQVAYGVDSLFSFYKNHATPETANGIVVSCGYQSVHLLPVKNGRLDAGHCRRINTGGCHLDAFMHRMLQLKFPGHMAAITLSRAEELVREHTHMATDYINELEEWADVDYYEDHVHKIQLPYTAQPSNTLTAEQQKEKKEQQIRRLKEINAKKRLERLAADQERLQQLMSVQELMADDDEEAFNKALDDLEFSDPMELQEAINKLSSSIQRAKDKVMGVQTQKEEEPETKQPVYDLLDTPDDMLTDDLLQKKKRQQFLKAAAEGRAKARKLNEEKRKQELMEEKRMEEKRKKNFQEWLAETRKKRQVLLDKRNQRKQRKSDMAKRRTFASQQRMKIISQLAEGEKKKKKEDTFGMNDDDWNVYKEINIRAGDSDSEMEQEQLEELETMLKEYDEEFAKDCDPQNGDGVFDIAEYYRLHVSTEQIRIPELLFQPSILGMEQGGIVETLDFILKKYSPQEQLDLVQYVFLTGGCVSFQNMKERMENEIMAIRPFQSPFSVHMAEDPVLDAWHGARKWALSSALKVCSITRAEYEEKGGEYLKEHCVTNRYIPTPVLVPT